MVKVWGRVECVERDGAWAMDVSEEMRRMAFVIHLLSHLLQGAPPWVGSVACMG